MGVWLMGARRRALEKMASGRSHGQAPFQRSWCLSPAQTTGQKEGTPLPLWQQHGILCERAVWEISDCACSLGMRRHLGLK